MLASAAFPTTLFWRWSIYEMLRNYCGTRIMFKIIPIILIFACCFVEYYIRMKSPWGVIYIKLNLIHISRCNKLQWILSDKKFLSKCVFHEGTFFGSLSICKAVFHNWLCWQIYMCILVLLVGFWILNCQPVPLLEIVLCCWSMFEIVLLFLKRFSICIFLSFHMCKVIVPETMPCFCFRFANETAVDTPLALQSKFQGCENWLVG